MSLVTLRSGFFKVPFTFNGGGFDIWFEGMLIQTGVAYGGYVMAHWSTWKVLQTDPRFMDILPAEEIDSSGGWFDEATGNKHQLWRECVSVRHYSSRWMLLLTRMEEEAR